MGCDIHVRVEVRTNGKWQPTEYNMDTEPFGWRSYSVFAWLAGVRNYSHITPISEPRGLPGDMSDEVRDWFGYGDEWSDFHSLSHLTLAELLAVNYDHRIEDWRGRKQRPDGIWDGAATMDQPTLISLREFLGSSYFEDASKLRLLGDPDDVRIVFGFDN